MYIKNPLFLLHPKADKPEILYRIYTQVLPSFLSYVSSRDWKLRKRKIKKKREKE